MIQVNNREYRLPTRPTVVVCLDGSSREYIDGAVDAGVAPFLESVLAANRCRMAMAAMPTFTNPNNMSIVTGAPPSIHGISGNFFLDRETGRAVMTNDPSFLRAPTILSACARAGATVAAVVAKDKLRRLIGAGLAGICISAEQEGVPVYSAELSLHALRRGVELMRSERPDVLYLSTSDFIQHAHAPGTDVANTFYAAVDEELAILDDGDLNLVVTADHGMSAKSDIDGHPRIVYLQALCDEWVGHDTATVILPITDPYVAHHGSLGAFAWVYVTTTLAGEAIMRHLVSTCGIEAAWMGEEACRRFELPLDRAGDLAVVADRDHAIGTRATDHDLSVLHGPLRSHGGCAEQAVPLLFNRQPTREISPVIRNYDAFWLALNAL